MKILVTGCAGFIGFHFCKKLIEKKNLVIGIDNISNYYDQNLKLSRLKILKKNRKNFIYHKLDLFNKKKLFKKLKKYKIDAVVNLAAQAGVRYSLKYPDEYIKTNVVGFYNLLEFIKYKKINKLLFASSSSVYGDTKEKFFREKNITERQISLYAVSKKINEIISSYYSRTFGLSCIGMRFFTVYGPYGRPDMSIFKFTKSILENKKLYLNNFGKHARDFTYIDDCVESIYKLLQYILIKKNFFSIVNIAGGKKVKITNVVKILEKYLNKKAKILFRPMQFGDIENTLADNKQLKKFINFYPKTSIKKGIKNFCDWYKNYYC